MARARSAERKCLAWCNKFKNGRTALNDDPEKPRGNNDTEENYVIVDGLIRKDRSVKVHEMQRGKQLCNMSQSLETNNIAKEC
jgi:hypothetical protein